MCSDKAASAVNRRRHFLRIAGAVLALTSFAAGAAGAGAPPAELMAAEALPDIALGKPDAPVTIVEYASMTCTHCAAFHATAYPKLKSDYIDAGKVRFILREFPLDPLATAGFMLARCSGDEKRTAIVDLLFAQQKNWAFTEKPVESLAGLLKQTGMSQESFEACLKNQDLYDNINKVRDRAAEKFQVNATPTFFINGEKFSGELTAESLASKIDTLAKQ
ncbi:DsbA family protein [Methylocapsa palsarum]|uniref:Protein-disulfide isomerase n=1 Tax=Methylocapsa palsarum TaxID=1612308 RepID=A0A1I3Z4J0_9HYPH|nr:DsbA family protein [Methylocapsa palsarum]SFK38998.1 Protein-disulfide isomerase [Methylocapsa palsarum]